MANLRQQKISGASLVSRERVMRSIKMLNDASIVEPISGVASFDMNMRLSISFPKYAAFAASSELIRIPIAHPGEFILTLQRAAREGIRMQAGGYNCAGAKRSTCGHSGVTKAPSISQ